MHNCFDFIAFLFYLLRRPHGLRTRGAVRREKGRRIDVRRDEKGEARGSAGKERARGSEREVISRGGGGAHLARPRRRSLRLALIIRCL